jgi:hypothetical protein
MFQFSPTEVEPTSGHSYKRVEINGLTIVNFWKGKISDICWFVDEGKHSYMFTDYSGETLPAVTARLKFLAIPRSARSLFFKITVMEINFKSEKTYFKVEVR